MPEYIRRTRRPRTIRKIEILVIDDDLIIDMLRDLQFYDYVPSMDPLRREVIRLQARFAKLKGTHRSGHWDALREWLDPVIRRFHSLLPAEGYDQIRKYLLDRKRVEAKTLVFSESPY